MYESQHFEELQDNGSGFGDPNSWLSGDPSLSPTLRRNHPPIASSNPGNLDRVLFNDLVEMVPLVQSLIERKASSSFTRRGSMVYTKTPSRKIPELKGRNPGQSIPGRKKREHGEKENKTGSNGSDADSFSIFSSRGLTTDETEELDILKAQVEDLQKKLSEKEESLHSAEALKDEMSSVHVELDALKLQTSEKDSLIKSTQRQLSDAKIKLADKQAALEKIQWEAMTSNGKVEKLQGELNSVQEEISSFMLLFEMMLRSNSSRRIEDCNIAPCNVDNLPPIDDMDETQTQKMEEARKAYMAAVGVAKENKDEQSVAAAASARLHLQSFVLTKT